MRFLRIFEQSIFLSLFIIQELISGHNFLLNATTIEVRVDKNGTFSLCYGIGAKHPY